MSDAAPVRFFRVVDGAVTETRGNTDRAAFEAMQAARPGYVELPPGAPYPDLTPPPVLSPPQA